MANWQGKEERKNYIFRIDEDLQKEFKIICTRKNTNMSDVLNDFIERYVKHSTNPKRR